MYMTHVKAVAVKAMKSTFDADFPEADFRDLRVSIEYPVLSTDFPSIWVDFDPIGPLRPTAVGHFEDNSVSGGFERVTRWSYAGNLTYTCVALTAFERDRLFDQMISVIAFAQVDTQRGEFRSIMETSPLVAINVNYHEIDQRGFSAAPGTPWGTDAMMYEATMGMSVTGEFISVPSAELLLPISQVDVFSWVNGVARDPTTSTPEWID